MRGFRVSAYVLIGLGIVFIVVKLLIDLLVPIGLILLVVGIVMALSEYFQPGTRTARKISSRQRD